MIQTVENSKDLNSANCPIWSGNTGMDGKQNKEHLFMVSKSLHEQWIVLR